MFIQERGHGMIQKARLRAVGAVLVVGPAVPGAAVVASDDRIRVSKACVSKSIYRRIALCVLFPPRAATKKLSHQYLHTSKYSSIDHIIRFRRQPLAVLVRGLAVSLKARGSAHQVRGNTSLYVPVKDFVWALEGFL